MIKNFIKTHEITLLIGLGYLILIATEIIITNILGSSL